MPYEKTGKETRCIADEIPFDIPDSWEWVRLGNLCNFGECVNVEPSEIAEDAWVLDLEDIEKDTGKLLQKKTKHETKCTSTKHAFFSGQILYSKLRPYLNKVLIAPADGVCTSEILPLSFWGPLFLPYVKIFLMSPGFVAYTVQCSYGVKMPRLGTEDGKRALFPLPPLAEQRRIVAKIEELLSHLDEYDQAETRVKKLNAEFPEQLKKSILQWAIQGKLVPQDPNDEPASVLLDRIRAEKAKLVKAGKIKKDKVESSIFRRDNSHYEKLNGIERCIDDEIPFEIPDSWAWTRCGIIFQVNPRNIVADDVMVGFIPMPLLQDGFQSKHSFEIKRWKDVKRGFTHFRNNDIVIAKITPCFQNRKSAVVANLPNKHGAGTTELHVLRDNTNILCMNYFLWIFKSHLFIEDGKKNFTGTAGQQRIGKDFVSDFLLPIPPVAEQKRIVEAIELLFCKLSV